MADYMDIHPKDGRPWTSSPSKKPDLRDKHKSPREIESAASTLLEAIRTATAEEKSHYLKKIALTGSSFSGDVSSIFENQLKVLGGQEEKLP